jgi:hypothetical protein
MHARCYTNYDNIFCDGTMIFAFGFIVNENGHIVVWGGCTLMNSSGSKTVFPFASLVHRRLLGQVFRPLLFNLDVLDTIRSLAVDEKCFIRV